MNISLNFSEGFIRRPVATTLLTIAILLAGGVAFHFLAQAPLPEIDFPTIYVHAGLPGASPETMASAVATPLERQFGRIAGVAEMTSSSSLGSTGVALQFDLNRDINAAARDVQACIDAAVGLLPAGLPSLPGYHKVNPADAPIMLLGLTSNNIRRTDMFDATDFILDQKLSQVMGIGEVDVFGGAQPLAVRVEVNPSMLSSYGIGLEQVRTVLQDANARNPVGSLADSVQSWNLFTTDQLFVAREYNAVDRQLVQWRPGAIGRYRLGYRRHPRAGALPLW